MRGFLAGRWSRCLLATGLFVSLSAPARAPAAESAGTAAPEPIVVPFEVRRGHILISAKANGSKPLSFMVDSGSAMTMLRPGVAEELNLRRSGRVTIVGIAGEAPANVYEGPTLEFAGTTWKPRRVSAFPPGSRAGSRERDGTIGSGFFRRFVVEIDPKAKKLRLHEPATFNYQGGGEVLPIRFRSATPIVEATLVLPDKSAVKAEFEVDSGCDGALCLGQHFVKAHQLAAAGKADEGRQGVGGDVRTRTGELPEIRLGRLTANQPEASFFLEGSPTDPPVAGHIGYDLLRQFKVIFDYSRRQMILEKQ